MITLGNEDNITLKVGTETVVAVYMGTEQVYPNTPPAPVDYSTMYFTTQMLGNGVVTISNNQTDFEYSRNNGQTWASASSGTSVAHTVGEKIIWKCTSPVIDRTYGCGNFTSNNDFIVYGNIMSLVYGDSFIGQTSLLDGRQFRAMFYNSTYLTSAEHLIMPATTLTQSCCSEMFHNCTSLTTAPELPALTLIQGCYNAMFEGCTSLNYIKAMFTTTPGTGYTPSWVNGVSATGTFVKNSAAQWNVTGKNGIPTGWTVQTASE